YYKPGPITPSDRPIAYRLLKPESDRSRRDSSVFGRAYVDGNVVEGNPRVTADNWAGGVQIDNEPDAGPYTDLIRAERPFPMARVKVRSAEEAYRYVLENVGATLPKRDEVDARIIREVSTGKLDRKPGLEIRATEFVKRRLPADSYKQGIIADVSQVGGYPEYRGTPYVDSDGDG